MRMEFEADVLMRVSQNKVREYAYIMSGINDTEINVSTCFFII